MHYHYDLGQSRLCAHAVLRACTGACIAIRFPGWLVRTGPDGDRYLAFSACAVLVRRCYSDLGVAYSVR
jgi:hypothetical protein